MLREGDVGWYVRYEGTGEISGPRSKEDAQSLADAAGGIIFSEQIFSPEEANTSSEVESLIEDLNKVLVGDLRERAGRIIEELSHPRYVIAGDVGRLIAEMRSEISKQYPVDPHKAPEAYTLARYESRLLLQRAVEMLVELSREKLVTGSIWGGALTLDDLPLGVRVEVRDYDMAGDGGEDVLEDGDGRYVLSAWGH